MEFRNYKPGVETTAVVKKLPVTVQGTPKIVITGMDTVPEEIEPGKEAEIDVHIRNEGTGTAHKSVLSMVAEADSETGESLIVPVLSGGIYYLGDFAPDEEATARFKFRVDNEAEYRSYLSTLTVSYNDEAGTSQQSTFSIGLPVMGNPVIEVLSAKLDNGAYKVDIENIGTADAKALKIALVQNGEVVDSSVANELKPNKHKTIRFQGFGYGNAAINISYLDEKNDFFSQELPVTITRSAYAEEQSGEGGVSSSFAVVLVVVIVLESYYVWRIRKRLKK
jgi:hypothetical protein